MKNDNRVIGAITLAVIYLLAVNVIANQPITFEYGNAQTSGQEHYFSGNSVKLFCHTPQSEDALNGYKNPVFAFTTSANKLWALFRSMGFLIESGFNQYHYYSLNLRIKYRKANLLFPFHSFW